MYRNGDGVPQNYIEALRWFKLAAEQGDSRAQFSLGLMYYDGSGVPQNYVQAHKWLNLSAANGDEKSKEFRDEVGGKMTPSQIAEAQKLAAEWMGKHPQ